ncbi:MAG: glycosyltransferase family 2 protein [Paraprevotella sp.]|nr:glycosyltransferase family 2 protein [Paraprevotella sp.]
MVELSVIVPVYNIAAFIGRCAETLMRQTMQENVEYIFVNDASPDDSMARLRSVIERYPNRHAQIQILEHEHNKGLPAARNTGLKHAKGEYVMHIDGDDYMETDALKALYEAARKNDADVVWCSYYLAFENRKKVIKQPSFSIPQDAVKGMLRGTMKYNVWNKLCRKSLYTDNGIAFPEGKAMGEDLTMIMVFLNAKRCAYVNSVLYNYVQSPNQMTANYTEEKLESLRYNCNRISRYIDERFSDMDYRSEYSALKQLMKWPFLLDGKYSSYKRWHQWFPESNDFIWQTQGVNTRIKFIEWCAALHLLPIIWIHYILVIKLYYGIVYK